MRRSVGKNHWRILAANRNYSSAVLPSTSTSTSTPTSEPKPKKSADSTTDWKLSILRILDQEFKWQNQTNKQIEARRQALGNVMRFSLKQDMQSILRLAENQTRRREIDDVLPMCLLVINKQFEQILKTVENIKSQESLALFLNISNLWKSIKPNNPDNTLNLMCLLVLGKLREWKDQRDFDEKSGQIDRIFEEIEKKTEKIVRFATPDDLRIFLAPKDLNSIKLEFDRIHKFYIPKPKFVDKSKYLADSELLQPFQNICSKENYNGNPFKIDNGENQKFEELFEKHMELEASMWIQVKNTVAKKEEVKEYGEDLIYQWKWKMNIEKELGKLENEENIHPLVASCIEIIPREKLVELLHFSALSACSQGQDLLSATQFQYDLISPIIKEMCNIFKIRMGYPEKEVWKNVFKMYSEYFSSEDLSRKNTLREWWNESCMKNGIKADYQFEMGNLDLKSKMEAGNVFFEVLQKSCVFPVESKATNKISWHKAFSFRSISTEEESRINPDGRQSLSKMLSIDRRLSKIFNNSHPFEFIIFSTSNLPMTIPPRPWIDYGIGGPLYTSNIPIIRNMFEFKNVDMNLEVRKRISSRQQARPVFDALNQLGSTPWVINEKMLEVLKEVFGKSGDFEAKQLLDKLGIPMRKDTVEIPMFEKEFGIGIKKEDIDKEKFREYAKRKSEAIKMKNESNSLWCWMLYRVVLADHFRGKTLYFPHNMDFRGRVYPLSPYLSHMGDDVNRCILKFAKSKKLGNDGFEWLKLHCINLTGTMKRASVEERLKTAQELLPTILDSARNPFGVRFRRFPAGFLIRLIKNTLYSSPFIE
ncbi:unnamed protein product [Caenorhabditis angaria]|uniref:DNA-directed RNA polymerase n=1 Tax=Caenorhabditis angaria TaxID=860376 RepID=A0A9P1I3Y9_9PELO|nr:unnamed protein product [Caenorhabditis angaria]